MNESIEILLRYLNASTALQAIVEQKAKGDWTKAPVLLINDPDAKLHLDEMTRASIDFRKLTAAGNFYKLPDDLKDIAESVRDFSESEIKEISNAPLRDFLEFIRDARELWDWHEDKEAEWINDDIIGALNNLMSLPYYAPDSWMKRSFLIQGIRTSSHANILRKIETAYKEACACFIYGQMNAACAMARAVLESALKERFSNHNFVSLGAFINREWNNIDNLVGRPDLQNKAFSIHRAGNLSLHEHKNSRLLHIENEFYTMNILTDLKDILEYLYK